MYTRRLGRSVLGYVHPEVRREHAGLCTPWYRQVYTTRVYVPVYHPGYTMRHTHHPWSYSAVSTPRTVLGRGVPGLKEENSYGHEAHRGPGSPKGVRKRGPLCAEFSRFSRKNRMKDWITIG